nr:arginine N-succinyltransferase [Algicola sagamiensis]
MIIRPIRSEDFPALLKIAEDSGHGFTSLPVNEELLKCKIERSVQSFHKEVTQAGDESYLFVMEDLDTGCVVGTSAIEAAVGLDDAFYHYHMSKVVHSSRELDIYNTVDLLTLCNDYTGATEICTLFLDEGHRINNNGKVLSKMRFMFMTNYRERFSSTIFAEMRGVSDDAGNSPFWQWLQEHFFSMDFPTADYLTGIGQKQFIAELMPKYPIYVNLLSKEAQSVIGEVHPNTRPAIEMLKSEGFRFRGYVDIFDAGPTVEAHLDDIQSARNSVEVEVKIGERSDESSQAYIVTNLKLKDFRATQLRFSKHVKDEAHVVLTQKEADALLVSPGDKLRIVAL